MNLERQKENFKNHIATLTDYGDIKILDFKAPNTNDYRIRFLFEEDYCRLHISGDLGELVACNYRNMTYDKFTDFVNDVGYFESKVQCHNRPFYVYDEEATRKDIKKYLSDGDYIESIVMENVFREYMSEEDIVDEFIDDVMGDFSSERGIGSYGYQKLMEIVPNIWEDYEDFGKEETGILDLYMLAFQLAQDNLKK